MHVIETEDYGNVRIEIAYDEWAQENNPRDWFNITTIIGWHRRNEIGDVNIRSDSYTSWDDMIESVMDEYEPVMIAPLYWYEHSGATCKMGVPLDTSGNVSADDLAGFRSLCLDDAGWDSGVAGLVLVTPKALAEAGTDPADVEQVARQEIETYARWIEGNVFGYVVSILTTCDHGDEHADTLDSCWGFVGESDYCLSEARAYVGGMIVSTLAGWGRSVWST